MAGNNRLIHTPEGVKDSYNGECRKKLAVQDKILDTFYLYGYEHIQTPSFEYFDIFSKDRGSVPDREMFKFFDRDNNTLVLRIYLGIFRDIYVCLPGAAEGER